MNFKEALNFAKDANFGKDVTMFLGYDILDYLNVKGFEPQEDDEEWCAAIPLCNDKGKVLKFIICIGKRFWRRHKNKHNILKFILLHEIGHTHTYTPSVFNSDENSALWELDAQIWAIKRAETMKLKLVKKRAIENFETWSKLDNPYKLAREIFLKNPTMYLKD